MRALIFFIFIGLTYPHTVLATGLPSCLAADNLNEAGVVSYDLNRTRAHIAKLNKQLTDIKARSRQLNKQCLLKKMGKQKSPAISVCQDMSNKLAAQQKKMEQQIRSAKKTGTLFEKDLREVMGKARKVICAIEEDLLEINGVGSALQGSSCQQDLSDLQDINNKLLTFKTTIFNTKESEELQTILTDFGHQEWKSERKVAELRFKTEWADKLTELSNSLLRLRETGGNHWRPEYEALLDMISREQEALAKLSSEEKCSQKLTRIRTFLSINRPVLLLLGGLTDLKTRTVVGAQAKGFLNQLVEITDWEAQLLNDLDPISAIKGIVLYVHWDNDPYSATQSNRAQIDGAIEVIESAWNEFSYGHFVPRFDVCEVNANEERTMRGYDLMTEFVRLCDPIVNYNDYDLVVLYPTNSATATYQGSWPFDTSDSPAQMMKPIITMGNGVFDSNTLLHEGGHYLGLEHAHWGECDENVFGPTCRTSGGDYGDKFDTMGRVGHYNCAYKEELGWTTSTLALASCGDSTVTLAATEISSEDPHCLVLPIDNSITDGMFADYRVTNPCDNLYVEYRKPLGYDQARLEAYRDAGYYDSIDYGGLALHCVTSEGGLHAWLLDCQPNGMVDSSSDFNDSLLQLGRTCHTGLEYDISFVGLPLDRAEVHIEPTSTYIQPPEICDGIDNNCDGDIDEECNDNDTDGYCDASLLTIGNPSSCSNGGGDCDDANASTNPGVAETCDGFDNNCDGRMDEGCDTDGDDYCDSSMTIVGAPASCPNGGGDCDDGNYLIHPGRLWPENCNDIDDDCDGVVDELCVTCDDSDGGLNYGTGGHATQVQEESGSRRTEIDECVPDGRIREARCLPAGVSHLVDTCPTDQTCIDNDGPDGDIPAYCGTE